MKSPKVRIKLGRPLSAAAAGLSAMILAATFAGSADALPTALKVTNVTLEAPKRGAAEIHVKTGQKPSFTARIADGGNRILVDLSGASLDGAPPAIIEGNDVV